MMETARVYVSITETNSILFVRRNGRKDDILCLNCTFVRICGVVLENLYVVSLTLSIRMRRSFIDIL